MENNKVFFVRAKPHGINREKQFLEGTISIGWPCIGDLRKSSKEEIEKLVTENWDAKKIASTQIYNFLNIPNNSIILSPSINSQEIHIFKTIETCTYNESVDNKSDGNPHQIKVDLLKTVERKFFSDLLQKSFKSARKTVTIMSKYIEDVTRVINGEEKPKSTLEKSLNESMVSAIKTLEELLKSENEEVRLQASLGIINANKI